MSSRKGETLRRWLVAAKDKGLAKLAKMKLLDSRSEHFRIVDRERNPERQAFYELAWHIATTNALNIP